MASLSDSDRKELRNNPNVLKVTSSNVTYKPSFKIKAVKLLLKGLSPNQIFEDAGINLALFNDHYAKKSIQRWKKIFTEKGEKALNEERRGIGSKGRPAGKKFKSLEDEIAYLKAENDFLKKLRALAEKSEQKIGSL